LRIQEIVSAFTPWVDGRLSLETDKAHAQGQLLNERGIHFKIKEIKKFAKEKS
jgi:hypothetical protein